MQNWQRFFLLHVWWVCLQRELIDNWRVLQESLLHFRIKLGDQGKTLAPHIVCKSCKESLRLWTTGKKTALKFGISMIWHEPANHFDDCYFCMMNLVGSNQKNQRNIFYPSSPSAARPIPHCDENPVPVFKELSIFLFQLPHLILYHKSRLKVIQTLEV